MTPPSTGHSLPRQGLLLLVALTFFWGVNWPAMKITMAEMTPWTYRSITGVTGAIGLLLLTVALRQRLSVPRHEWPKLIAMALVNGPRLLIADEPTTGLDVTVQAQVLDLLAGLVHSRNMATIIITHDLGVVSHYCTRIAVMFAGTIVETGAVDEVLNNPRHPYTRELIDSVPERIIDRGYRKVGRAPDLYNLPSGCLFRYRCPMAAEICHSAPPAKVVGPGHAAR